MPTMIEYKCPCCGGVIEFDSGTQQMKCPYCDTTFDLETLKSFDEVLREDQPQEEMKWDVGAGSEWSADEADAMGVFVCNSCGGQIVADANTAATSCPFCGNPIMLTGRLSGDLCRTMSFPSSSARRTPRPR